MANFVSPVSFQAPEDQAAAQAIERRRALSGALTQQSMEPIQEQKGGRFAVPINPLQGVSKLAQAYVGQLGQRKADEQQQALASQVQARRGADMSALVNALRGSPAQPAGLSEDASGNVSQQPAIPAQAPGANLGQVLPMIQDPAMQQMGMQFLGQQAAASIPKKPEPYTLAPGAQRFDEQNRPVASVPPKPEPYTLAPGSTRYGPDGQVIASAPDKPEKPPEQMPVTPVEIVRPDGRVVKVDGRTGRELGISPNDAKLAGAFNADTAQLQGTTAGLDRLAMTANQLLNHPGLGGIVGLRGKIPNIPGSDAANAQALLDTLKSQVGFGVLQDMRNASKTGGALGSVSDAEGKRLEANLAALANTQDLKQFQSSLQQILSYSEQAKDRMRDAFNMKHGGHGGLPTRPGEQPQQAAAPTPQRRSTDKKTVKWGEL